MAFLNTAFCEHMIDINQMIAIKNYQRVHLSLDFFETSMADAVLLENGIIYGKDGAARISEDFRDTLFRERLQDDLRTCHLFPGHGVVAPSASSICIVVFTSAMKSTSSGAGDPHRSFMNSRVPRSPFGGWRREGRQPNPSGRDGQYLYWN